MSGRGLERRYRDRLERLRYRAAFLRRLIETKPEPERTWSRERAEISALEWAVGILTPWFDKRDEEPASGSAIDPSAADPGTPTPRA